MLCVRSRNNYRQTDNARRNSSAMSRVQSILDPGASSACCVSGKEKPMIELTGVAHFSIPVSDVDKSTKFYTEVVGCKFLSQLPNQKITFLDAGRVCVLLLKRPAPVRKRRPELSDGGHRAFMVDASQYHAA